MKYADPQGISCPNCRHNSQQSVAALLNLLAKCPQCLAQFTDIGLEMRRNLDDVSSIAIKVLIFLSVEDLLKEKFSDEELNIDFDDEELESVATLANMIDRIDQRLVVPAKLAISGEHLVETAIRNLRSGSSRDLFPTHDGDLDLNLPILDAIDPDRWKRKRD